MCAFCHKIASAENAARESAFDTVLRSVILTSCPERMILACCHVQSVAIFCRMKPCNSSVSLQHHHGKADPWSSKLSEASQVSITKKHTHLAMKTVPGVMQFESKGSCGTAPPFFFALSTCSLPHYPVISECSDVTSANAAISLK
jgi:hypothetical protein